MSSSTGRTNNSVNDNVDLLNINDSSTTSGSAPPPAGVKVDLFNLNGDINSSDKNNSNISDGGGMADLLGGFSDFVSSAPISSNVTANPNAAPIVNNDSFIFDPFGGTTTTSASKVLFNLSVFF